MAYSNNRIFKAKLQLFFFFKKNNDRNCNSEKYTLNVQREGIFNYFDGESFDSVTYINR